MKPIHNREHLQTLEVKGGYKQSSREERLYMITSEEIVDVFFETVDQDILEKLKEQLESVDKKYLHDLLNISFRHYTNDLKDDIIYRLKMMKDHIAIVRLMILKNDTYTRMKLTGSSTGSGPGY